MLNDNSLKYHIILGTDDVVVIAEVFFTGNCSESAARKTSRETSKSDFVNDSPNARNRISAFVVTPNETVVEPKATQTFTLTFSPMEIGDFKVFLRSDLSNLSPTCSPLEILVKTKSLLPLYHFDLESSDYIKNRRKQKICGETLNENTRVVEFEAIGLGAPVIRFAVVTFVFILLSTDFSQKISHH